MATTSGSNVGEKINTDIVTLTRFLTEEQSKHKEATGDFTYALQGTLLIFLPYSPGMCANLECVASSAMLSSSLSNLLPTTSAEQLS